MKLATRDLSISFGGVHALEGVDLEIGAGEIRGIIGPNGAGKTTLVNLMTGVNRPTRGDVLLDGRSIVGESASAVAARGIRRTFQTTQLFGGLSVLENVMAGCHADIRTGLFSAMFSTESLKRDEREAEDRAREALEFVRMTPFADRDAGQLSFGQSRMIEIARAIVSRPQVLLLDEPAVGLSLDRVHELEDLIRRVRDERGVTIIMVEHVIRLVMNVCDRITVLSSGRKIAEGTADEVTRNDIVIEAYLGRKLDADSPQP
jgi:branched-chain amino acid transport system ATP-binding protein